MQPETGEQRRLLTEVVPAALLGLSLLVVARIAISIGREGDSNAWNGTTPRNLLIGLIAGMVPYALALKRERRLTPSLGVFGTVAAASAAAYAVALLVAGGPFSIEDDATLVLLGVFVVMVGAMAGARGALPLVFVWTCLGLIETSARYNDPIGTLRDATNAPWEEASTLGIIGFWICLIAAAVRWGMTTLKQQRRATSSNYFT